jgi:hypothetical protein
MKGGFLSKSLVVIILFFFLVCIIILQLSPHAVKLPPHQNTGPVQNQHPETHNTTVIPLVFTWEYQGKPQDLRMTIPASLYDYYRSKPHNKGIDYPFYVFSRNDRPYLKSIIDSIRGEGKWNEYEVIMNLISFIQSFPYVSDDATTGYDDYTRYPLETIIDGGGDCEDTAVLAAALLDQMGYGTVLILFPSHLGVGVRASNSFDGTYFEYQGDRYYYLETTGKGYKIGEVPEVFRNKSAIIIPLTRNPSLKLSVDSVFDQFDQDISVYNISCEVQNSGTETAYSPVINIAALAIDQGSGFIWAPDITLKLSDVPAGENPLLVNTTLRIPKGQTTQIRCTIYGNNFETITTLSEQFQA